MIKASVMKELSNYTDDNKLYSIVKEKILGL